MKVAAAQRMRELDRIAIEERAIPSTQLMERAAQAVAETAEWWARENQRGPGGGHGRRNTGTAVPLARRPNGAGLHAVCFCGPGNNGGDGVAAARLLLERGCQVRAFLVGQRAKMSPDCREMERRLQAAGGELEDFRPEDQELAAWCRQADVLVDALFGIGLNTQLRGDALAAVTLMNRCPVPTVAVDVPSGVEADTGRILGAAVEAAATVTFTQPKAGHLLGAGGACSGRLIVADIGIPQDLLLGEENNALCAIFPQEICLPRRARESHKGNYGRVYLLGGSTPFSGAPVLAARAAERSGAGLVSVGVPAPVWPAVAARLEGPMPHPLPAGGTGQLAWNALEEILTRAALADVCLLGPGLGRGEETACVVRELLKRLRCPVVLDADGINALEGHIDTLDDRRDRLTILTPHDGEFARLSGHLPGEDRVREAQDFAARYGCCLVLKGHRTIIALPDRRVFVNTTGNPGMAKGGSGDVLAGMIAALVGQGFPVDQGVPMAVCLHGEAGDWCSDALGEYGMTPADLLERLPQVLAAHTLRG